MSHIVHRFTHTVLLYLFTFLPFYLSLVSCGVDNGRFRLEGQLENVDQSEFYIYSIDAGNAKLDTITVAQGHFVYETNLKKLATFVLLYPNLSEQVIYGNSGVTAKLRGDASHLKEVEVTGTDENDQMTAWRLSVSEMTPPQVKQEAIKFIRENPSSILCNYILQRYLLTGDEADYKTAAELAALMLKAQPDNGHIIRLEKQLRGLKYAVKGATLPDFQATDINGNAVSRQSLKGELNIISTWSLWNFESQTQQRRLQALQRKYGSRLGLLSISLDASKKDCRKFLERDSIRWNVVCDGQVWETPLVLQLGFSDVPGNLLVDGQGKVLDVNMPTAKIEEKVRAILK